MELDELKSAWHELDRRLEVGETRVRLALSEFKRDKTRRALRRHNSALIFELVFDVLALAFVGSFLADEFSVAKFALPALVLSFVFAASIAVIVAQLVAGLRIDYSAPVLAIQRRIAEIRTLRIRSTQLIFLFAPLLWTPLAIVSARRFLDLDVYAVLGNAFVALNVAIGLAVIPLGIRAAQLCADRLGHSPVLKRLADSVAGNSLTRAMESMDELDRFQQEG